MAAGALTLVDHPLVQHRLTILRRRQTDTTAFRKAMRDLGGLLAYEATRDLALRPTRIETPLEEMEAGLVADDAVCLVSILRAGNGPLEGMIDLIPFAPVGHIGMYRDPATHEPVEYFINLPGSLRDRLVLVVDPMLATGNSAVAAIDRLKQEGANRIRFLCLVAAPEGVATLTQAHPDVAVYTAALDRGLNEKAYIVPGLGDAGDRLYRTS